MLLEADLRRTVWDSHALACFCDVLATKTKNREAQITMHTEGVCISAISLQGKYFATILMFRIYMFYLKQKKTIYIGLKTAVQV